MPNQMEKRYKTDVGMPQNQCGLANIPNSGKLNKTMAIMKTPIKREALRDIFLLFWSEKHIYTEGMLNWQKCTKKCRYSAQNIKKNLFAQPKHFSRSFRAHEKKGRRGGFRLSIYKKNHDFDEKSWSFGTKNLYRTAIYLKFIQQI
jgi:hypothetical protein